MVSLNNRVEPAFNNSFKPQKMLNRNLVNTCMKASFLGMFLAIMAVQTACAQQKNMANSTQSSENAEKEILDLSKEKWRWMSEKKADTLADLFHEKAVFVHMGGSWGRDREIEVIRGGGIWYKKAEVYSASVNFIGNTAILLNDIDLLAVVGGNEVVNPFMVTEVYVKENGKWKMGSLTFSRLLRPVKMNKQ